MSTTQNPDSKPTLAVDHLVVAAHTLAQGVQWCETALGVTPGPGGEHVLMGTHNRLLNLSGPSFALVYLEIVAINPAAPGPTGGRKRWFGLDDPALQQALQQQGPQLVHWVARSSHMAGHRQGLLEQGFAPGEPVAASRPTPHGLLQWEILLRHNGSLMNGGAVPTLIEWQGTHPAAAMPPSGLALMALAVGGQVPAPTQSLLHVNGVQRASSASAPALAATLSTPLGQRTLRTAKRAA